MAQATGPDVSHWHPVRDWTALFDSGATFLGAKASEGAANEDPTFRAHRDGARQQPLDLVIFYHLARPGDAAAQARRFLDLVGPLRDNERLALDTERTSGVGIDWIDAFFAEMPADRRPILYTSNGVWTAMGSPSWVRSESVDLWLPRYGASEPVIPGSWQSWAFWQQSQGATVPGVDGPCDMNVFHGDQDALRQYAKLAPVVT